jgi:capsular polysaccharide biosynthesis protein
MAPANQSQNQLMEVATALRRRLAQVLAPAAVVLSLGVLASGLVPKKFTAYTALEVRDVPLPFSGQGGMDTTAIVRDVTATPWQIKQYERVRRVIEKLEWPEYTALNPAEQNDFVRKQIEAIGLTPVAAKNAGGSSLIGISYKSDDPQRAEQFLNRLRDAYTQEVLDRYRKDARLNLEVLRNNMSTAATEVKKRNEESAKFQKDYAISATQQAPGGGRQRDEDPVFTRLNQSIVRLADVESQITSDKAAIEALKEQYEAEPLTLADAAALAGGISFDDELARIEQEIADLRETQRPYKEIATPYQVAERKIRILEEKAAQLRSRASAPELRTTTRPNPRRDQLLADIQQRELSLKQAEAQRAQLDRDVGALRLQNAERVEIFKELRDLDARATVANDNYQKASAAFLAQKRFVDQITEGTSSPFEVTELARAPTQPSSPSGAIVVAGSAILGLGIGLLWALASEFGRNGFRGAADAGRALAVPVLGIVNEIRTRSQRRDDRTRRAIAAVATLALVGSILWVAWAFDNRPQLLGSGLARALGDLREALR